MLRAHDLGAFCRLDALDLQVTGQRPEADRAEQASSVEPRKFDRRCRWSSAEGAPRDMVTRRLAPEPFEWRPTTLLVTVRRYRCTACGRV